MAALSSFPSFFSLFSHKPFAPPLPSLTSDHNFLHLCHHTNRHPAIFASSIKIPRASRKGMSNADLCYNIREFLSAAGLPEGHVPSLKELSQHGRQDLTTIVRRRGYKLIKQLLERPAKSDKMESNTEFGLNEKQDISVECEYELTGQKYEVEEIAEVILPSKVSVKQYHLNSAKGANTDCAVSSESSSCMGIESSTNASLQKKVTKFIQEGELDALEEDGFGILHETGADGGNKFVELENVAKESSYLGEERSEWVLHRSDTAKIVSSTSISSSKQVVVPALGNKTPGQNGERENRIEVNHLKFMLHQKELELSRLKEQIEKEQLAVSILQTKAEREMSKARRLIMEKNAELHATEDNLSGLG